MLTCRSCMRRHVYALLGEPVLYQSGQRTTFPPKYASRAIERSYSEITRTWDRRLKPWERHSSQNRSLPSSRPPRRSSRLVDVEKELSYLGDPLKLANQVFKLLVQDKFDDAELLVQTASKHHPCTVSWNHLINWQLSKGKVNDALKTYNEMKKRGQKPDAHTYTILFRGLAEFSHYPQALSKALSIYHSMDAVNSPVKPNVIHTNAVLKVCARARDMDALYGIVAKLRQKGIRAPNNLTYTTIFNAIQRQAIEVCTDMEDQVECRAVCQRAILEARNLWMEVTEKWRQGDIFIDEELTSSMGRVLLLGGTQDVDDVFSLIEQTMNIPRLVPKPATADKPRLASTTDEKGEVLDGTEKSPSIDGSTDILPLAEFSPAKRPKTITQRSNAYAKPGPNSLSLVLEALKEIWMSRPLAAYWDVFTKTYNVKPDSNNYHTYLQNLRIRRASGDAVNFLHEMPKEMLQTKTFRIAMSTCSRDKNNKNSLAHAAKVLDLMQQCLPVLDLVVLHKYLEVALYGGGDDLGAAPKSEVILNETHFVRGRRILHALERLAPCILNVTSTTAYEQQPKPRNASNSEPVADLNSALDLVREMISAYDKLMRNGMVPQEMDPELKRERSRLAAFVTRYNAGPLKGWKGDKRAAGQDLHSEHVPRREKGLGPKRRPLQVTH